MGLLATIAQAFTVVRHQQDRGAVVELVRFQVAHEATHHFVCVGHFGVIG